MELSVTEVASMKNGLVSLTLFCNVVFGLIFVAELIASVGLFIAMAMSFDSADKTIGSAVLHRFIIVLVLTYPLTYLISLLKSRSCMKQQHYPLSLRWAALPGMHLLLLVLVGLLFFH
jgi:hypothetical protein